MIKVNIFWGPDSKLEEETAGLDGISYLTDVISIIDRSEVKIQGVSKEPDQAVPIPNLVVHTDDYGGLKEWAIMGFTHNILENLKVVISNVWMINPPKTIYDDIKRNCQDIVENVAEYPEITEDVLRSFSEDFDKIVIGQPHVSKSILPSVYGAMNSNRGKPVTLLFLGNSGVGKTETAKFLSECTGKEMVRIQFSMQQTVNAAQFIFGAEHGENSLARELIRRKSNVILLDEFDKVPPAFYNAFYQMFDEGLFVDKNYSVDVSRCIIICTSNYQTVEEAEQNIGTPLFSRFSKTVRFHDIGIEDRKTIARKVYSDIIANLNDDEQRLVPKDKVIDRTSYNGSVPRARILFLHVQHVHRHGKCGLHGGRDDRLSATLGCRQHRLGPR